MTNRLKSHRKLGWMSRSTASDSSPPAEQPLRDTHHHEPARERDRNDDDDQNQRNEQSKANPEQQTEAPGTIWGDSGHTSMIGALPVGPRPLAGLERNSAARTDRPRRDRHHPRPTTSSSASTSASRSRRILPEQSGPVLAEVSHGVKELAAGPGLPFTPDGRAAPGEGATVRAAGRRRANQGRQPIRARVRSISGFSSRLRVVGSLFIIGLIAQRFVVGDSPDVRGRRQERPP